MREARVSRSVRRLVLGLLVLLTAAWLSMPLRASAQSETAHDLINAVNELRALHGLQPYAIDQELMAYAQEHADYQASIDLSTHLHSDGSTPLSRGLEENVAAGTAGVVTVQVVVYEIWSDWGHRNVMVGYEDGQIGAGVATAASGMLYYTIDVRVGEPAAAVATVAPVTALQTSIPEADGSVVHTVGYGQTLWSIAVAYGVTINDIRQLNNIPADSTTITTGQKLLIRPAGSVTAEPAVQAGRTAEPSARAVIAPPATSPMATLQVAPSPTLITDPSPTPARASAGLSRTNVLIAVGIGILALSVAAIIGFMPTRKEERPGN